MLPEPHVWIFHDASSRFSGGAFTTIKRAEAWIEKYGLTGNLTAYPLDQGVLDWAEENGATSIEDEKLAAKKADSSFVGGFTSAAQDHYHYEAGKRVS